MSRSSAEAKPCANRPFAQAWPRLTGPSRAGVTAATRPSRTWTSSVHPTPQKPQVVVVTESIGRGSRKPGSDSAPVGQPSAHAPHETQGESIHRSPAPAATTVSNPRPCMVSAKVPCSSSQRRTHRPQAMHRSPSSLT